MMPKPNNREAKNGCMIREGIFVESLAPNITIGIDPIINEINNPL